MGEYIDKEKLLKYLEETNTSDEWIVNQYNADWIYSFIESQPTADVVEVETIKAWLYEMAINNVGCAIDGDFSNACEEIIARLDGLRKFAKERGGEK